MLVLGSLFVIGSAFTGAVTVWMSSTKIAVLTLQTDLDGGDVLGAEHLTVVEIEPTPGLSWVLADEQNDLIGLVARGPLESGQLLSRSQFAGRSEVIGDGRVVVAMALSPGDIPLSALAGDLVRLQLTGRSDGSTSSVVVAEAVVWSINPPSTGAGPILVSLLVAEESERAVSEAASSGRLKANLVGTGP